MNKSDETLVFKLDNDSGMKEIAAIALSDDKGRI